MNRVLKGLAAAFIITFVFLIAWQNTPRKNSQAPEVSEKSETPFDSQNKPNNSTEEMSSAENTPIEKETTHVQEQGDIQFTPPIDRTNERITKKTFGAFIDPKTSPVQPERFKGYHTGVDFEVFPEELNETTTVKAVCAGELLLKRSASGYGGVVVQICSLDSEPITVTYGHLKLSTVAADTGDAIEAGEAIGNLGAHESAETDGERKHLHLAFHKGSAVNIRGYVSTEKELAQWIDPCQYVCEK